MLSFSLFLFLSLSFFLLASTTRVLPSVPLSVSSIAFIFSFLFDLLHCASLCSSWRMNEASARSFLSLSLSTLRVEVRKRTGK